MKAEWSEQARADLVAIVLLDPQESGTLERLDIPQDQLAYALLRSYERFPPADAGPGNLRAPLEAANRDGFEASCSLARTVPGYRVRYPQPAGFPELAEVVAELVAS